MMRLFGQHEAAGARQRVEAGLRQAFKLHLAVAVGEIGEHEEGKPVRRLLVEGAEHARSLLRTRLPAQQPVSFLAAIGAEIFVQQVDHRPEMAAFLDVHLEQVAHVVERGRRLAEVALLFHRRRLGVALDDDQPAQHASGIRPALPAMPARPRARRKEWCGPRPSARAGCPSGIPASSHSRTWPSPWDRR